MREVILAYVPVLHQGYRQFFEKYISEVLILYLFGRELIEEFDHLRKDIRALSPEDVQRAIRSWRLFSRVSIANYDILNDFRSAKQKIIMPDEEECRSLTERYLDGCDVRFDSVFLRWDRTSSLAKEEVRFDRTVPFESFVAEALSCAAEKAKKASNWWRQVGAVIARDREVILTAYNRQVPSPRIQYAEGDPRSLFSRGLHIEITTDFHAEACLIALAAKEGISLKGTDLYLTTFPCPPCAKVVAYSGIKRCYFSSGYAMLDGERILRSQGVEIIFVK